MIALTCSHCEWTAKRTRRAAVRTQLRHLLWHLTPTDIRRSGIRIEADASGAVGDLRAAGGHITPNRSIILGNGGRELFVTSRRGIKLPVICLGEGDA